MGTKGPSLRRLMAWIARATSSFPVPLSPWTRTAGVRRCDLPHGGKNCLHFRTLADHAAEWSGLSFKGIVQRTILFFNGGKVKCPANDDLKLFKDYGFLVKVIGSQMDGFEGIFPLIISRYDNNFCRGVMSEHFLKTPEPFFGPLLMRRKPQIEGHNARRILLKQGK